MDRRIDSTGRLPYRTRRAQNETWGQVHEVVETWTGRTIAVYRVSQDAAVHADARNRGSAYLKGWMRDAERLLRDAQDRRFEETR